ncbi:MAG: hypothetical protein NC324_10325 [Bacteroides sp.]|nr:hypothetical protein [Bacteroides sp.]
MVLLISGCASLLPPSVTSYGDNIHNYKYFYINPTGDYTSNSSSLAVPIGLGMYVGASGMKTTTPSHVIAGILIKNGYIQVHEVKPEIARETMIVNFGETGRRDVNLGYAIEVSIQFISAFTQRPICTCTAEGQGETEADDVREAIQRALEPLFTDSSSNLR